MKTSHAQERNREIGGFDVQAKFFANLDPKLVSYKENIEAGQSSTSQALGN